jgi:hypothetical protein
MKVIIIVLQFCVVTSLFAQAPAGNPLKPINFTDLIGKNFDAIGFDEKTYSIEVNEEWRAEKGWTVKAGDGSFEMSLDTVRTIKTIWLHPVRGKFTQGDYSTNTTRKQIRAKHGKPTTHGDNVKAFVTKDAVSWDRYNLDPVAMHFEYSGKDLKLQMITLMTLKDAP